jgi:hypothetical protein
MRHHGLAVALALLACAPAAAQLPEYNVPDDPAFTFLGTSPKKIDNPGTVRALGMAFANGIDVNGRVQSGLALSFAPWDVLRLPITVGEYEQGSPRFIGYNTQVSLGTVRSSGDSASTDLAAGIRTILFGPDPLADREYRARVRAVQSRCLFRSGVDTIAYVVRPTTGLRVFRTRKPGSPEEFLPPSSGSPRLEDTVVISQLDRNGRVVGQDTAVIRSVRRGAVVEQDTVRMWPVTPNDIEAKVVLECANAQQAKLISDWLEEHWNDATLAFAGATGTRFVNSELDDRDGIGFSVWGVGAVPIRRWGQLAAQVRYDRERSANDAEDRSETTAGVRALVGRARYNGFAEWNRVFSGDEDGDPARKNEWSAGFEFLAAPQLWLSVGLGDRYSEVTDTDKAVLLLNLRWSTSRAPRLQPPAAVQR